jgi:hypothetical protein
VPEHFKAPFHIHHFNGFGFEDTYSDLAATRRQGWLFLFHGRVDSEWFYDISGYLVSIDINPVIFNKITTQLSLCLWCLSDTSTSLHETSPDNSLHSRAFGHLLSGVGSRSFKA